MQMAPIEIKIASFMFIVKHRMIAVITFLVIAIIFSTFRDELSFGSKMLEYTLLGFSILSILSACFIGIIPNSIAAEALHGMYEKPTFSPVGVNELCPCGSGQKFKKCCKRRF